jgi:hypothetical protein
MGKTPGRRLERYIKARWGRDKGGMRGLCKLTSFVPETLYSWFRGETDPSLDSLAEIASALQVRRSAILAAMDGEAPTAVLDGDLRELIAAEVARQLGGNPPRPPRG